MIGERLLVLLGPEANSPALREPAKALASAHGLKILLDRPNVLCATDHRKVQATFGTASAVILGDIFSRGIYGPALDPLRVKDLAESAKTDGRYLIERFWGGYIALFLDERRAGASILRAPFGRLAIYFAARGQTLIAASSVDFVLKVAGTRPSINWTSLAQHLTAHQLRGIHTCLDDVQELLPGFRLTAGQAQPEMIWNPAHYCPPHQETAPEAISARLRSTIDSSIEAWSKTYDSVVLGVSGGLDSSVVATSAMAAGAKLSCLTLVTVDPAGDERAFARDLTDYLGTELYEFTLDPHEIDLETSAAAHLPRPTARAFAQSGDRINLELAARRGAKAFFSGGGGDNVFCYLQSATILVDALRSCGLSKRTWLTAQNLAKLSGVSLWEVIYRGIARASRKSRRFAWQVDRTFLSENCAAPEPERHPWLEAAVHLPPGKQGHIALLMNVQNHLDGFAREEVLPVISPLLSQPLVEFCLSVPTWAWIEGGFNRAPVRLAYKDVLPNSVLRRRSKGTPDPYIIEVFETHRTVAREMLLGGHLAQRGLLDLAAIEEATSRNGPAIGLSYFRLLRIVDVEAWLRAWMARA